MPRKKVPINRRASIKLVHSIAVHPRFLILVIATALAAIVSIALGIYGTCAKCSSYNLRIDNLHVVFKPRNIHQML
jgi:Na+(H+)/acetate symporter ActP